MIKTMLQLQNAPDNSLHSLRNRDGMHVTISEHGAALVSWWASDRYGRVADILLGYAGEQDYARNGAYFGAVVGRCANRIAAARFSLDGFDYQLERNDGGNHLHGGPGGFHSARWQAQAIGDGLRLTLESAAGAGGYPGNMQVSVEYRLADDGALTIAYEARCDAPTPINLTAHPYFNLNGGSAGIGDHLLSIDADEYLQTDAQSIPVQAASVAGSAFDFRAPAPIGPRLAWPDTQLAQARGFDHCYCLRSSEAGVNNLREVASVYDPGSGRRLSVATTEAGLQFYSGNFLGGVQGRGAQPYAAHDGFCLEAQAFPNQINGTAEEAARVVLRPGQLYHQSTVYRISVES